MANIYIVASYNNTLIGKLIRWRARLKFWNRYAGDDYTHISLSLESNLENMMSFARKEVDNPFNAGLIKESIREGMFAKANEKSKIAVMKLSVTEQEFNNIKNLMSKYWRYRQKWKYNFVGLISMLLVGRGKMREDSYFCSQWVADILKECNFKVFHNKESFNVRPFDFYCVLNKYIIYEGQTKKYPYN